MSVQDPFQELVDSLKKVLLNPPVSPAPSAPAPSPVVSSSPSQLLFASPMARPAPFSGEVFREVFGRSSGDSSIGERLYHLKQGAMSIKQYSLKFRTLVAASGWNEPSHITAYRQGLNPKQRLHLAAYDDTQGLERFIQLAI